MFEVKDVSISETTRVNLSNVELVDADTRRIGAVTKNALLNWEELLVPERSGLFQNYPNPFNPETWIPFKLADQANVSISIYNAAGSPIRSLSLGELPAGSYISKDRAVYWDGKNDAGEKVGSGVYFYKFVARSFHRNSDLAMETKGNFSAVKKMVIMK